MDDLRANKTFRASDHAKDGKFHLLLAASGSVATIKIPNIIKGLANTSDIAIRVVLTRAAAEFLRGQAQEQPTVEDISAYPNVEGIHFDEDEWTPSWTRGAPILHIELRRWSNLLVIAPLSANTLAKIASGLCDNLLTSVVRAWEVVSYKAPDQTFAKASASALSVPKETQKPIIVAPSMNTCMWDHPVTAQHLGLLGQGNTMHWIEVLEPVEKKIACGDTGNGAMCEWNVITERILTIYSQFGMR